MPYGKSARSNDNDEAGDIEDEDEDEDEDTQVEERDLGTISDGESQRMTSLFSCPVDGCVKTYIRSSALQHHILIGDHKFRPDGETMYNKAKQEYARRLQEGLKENPTVLSNNETEIGQNNLTQGWALKSSKSRTSFNEKQKDFLNGIFQEGEKTGVKANPDTVAKAMRKATNENQQRIFELTEFLTPQQVASYFSRMKAQTKNITHSAKTTNPLPHCPTCEKHRLHLMTREKLQEINMKELRAIASDLKLGVKSRRKNDIVEAILGHTSGC